MIVATAEITVLEIKYYIVRSIVDKDISEVKSWNCDIISK